MTEKGIDLSKITREYQNKPGVNKSKKLTVSAEEYAQKNEEALRKNVFLNVSEENGKWSIDKDESAQILADAKKFAGEDSIFTAAEMKEMFTEWGYFDQRTDADNETQEEWFKKGVEDFTNYMAFAFDVDITGFNVEKAVQEVTFDGSETSSTASNSKPEQGQDQTNLVQQLNDIQVKVSQLSSDIAQADELTPLTINENSELLPIIVDEDGNRSVKAVRKSGGNSVYGILNTIYGYNSMEKEQKNALLTAFMDANPETFPAADSGLSMQERLNARKTITVGLELNLPETTAYLQSQELKTAQEELDKLNAQVGLYKDQFEEGDSIKRETNKDGTVKETLADSEGNTKSVVLYSKDNIPESKYDYVRDENGNVTEQYKYDLTSGSTDRPEAIIHFGYKKNDDGSFAVSSQTIEKDIEYNDAGQMLHSVTYGKDGKTVVGQTDWVYNEDGSTTQMKYSADGTTPVSSSTTVNGLKVSQEDYVDGVLSTVYDYAYDENNNLTEFNIFNCSTFTNKLQKYSYETGERALDSIVVQQYSDINKTLLQSEITYGSDGKTMTGKKTWEYDGYEVKETQYAADGTTPVSSVTTIDDFKIAEEIYDENGELTESFGYSYDDNGSISELAHFDCKNFTNTIKKYSCETGESVLDSVVVEQYADAQKSKIQSSTTYAADGKTITGKSVYATTQYNGQTYDVKTDYQPSPSNTVIMTYTDANGNIAFEDTLECFDDPIANPENGVVKKYIAKDYAAGTITTTEYNEDGTIKSTVTTDFDGNVQNNSLNTNENGDDDATQNKDSSGSGSSISSSSYTKDELLALGAEDAQGDTFAKYLDKKNLDVNTATTEELDAALNEYNGLIEQKNEFLELYEKFKSDPVLKKKLSKKYEFTDTDKDGGTKTATLDYLYDWVNDVGAFRTSDERGSDTYDKNFEERIASAVDQMNTMASSEFDKFVGNYSKSDLRKLGAEDAQGDTFAKYLDKKNLDIDSATAEELNAALNEYNGLIGKKNEFLELYKEFKSDPVLKAKLSKKYELTDTDEKNGTAKMKLNDLYDWVNDVGAFRTSNERGVKSYDKDFDERVASALDQMKGIKTAEKTKAVETKDIKDNISQTISNGISDEIYADPEYQYSLGPYNEAITDIGKYIDFATADELTQIKDLLSKYPTSGSNSYNVALELQELGGALYKRAK